MKAILFLVVLLFSTNVYAADDTDSQASVRLNKAYVGAIKCRTAMMKEDGIPRDCAKFYEAFREKVKYASTSDDMAAIARIGHKEWEQQNEVITGSAMILVNRMRSSGLIK